ncbi:hypothetical protein K438DRAFT_1772074 [Mycena galopus ATCC 62051]|nr:hypothetical protein K438DRAFT_1772074 [Mycena galopus ATCC 62051]
MYNPLLAVSIVTIVIESVLYGVLLEGKTTTHSKLLRFRRRLLNSDIRNVYHGLLSTPNIASALVFFADSSQVLFVLRTTVGQITLLIGDAVIVYRLWHIWSWDLRAVILPALSHLTIACTIAVTFEWSSTGHDLPVGSAMNWVITNWVLTVITNIYCTALIAWKVWTTTRAVRGMGDGMLMSVLGILIESAAIWTAWAVLIVVTSRTRSVLQSLTALTSQVIGLVNIFIHLRVELGWSLTPPDGSTVAMTMTRPASIEVWVAPTTTADAEYDGSVSRYPTKNEKSPSV